MDLKIKAFGACMIGGFPHPAEKSFFYLAVERLQAETNHRIIPSLFTFGGFPVTRVPKHLQPRCLVEQPDIVVVQFASSDLIVPLRRNRHQHSISSVSRTVSTANPGLADRVKWLACGIIGDALRLGPVTPPEIYLPTMEEITRAIAAAGVTPVILSPFVFGSRRSDRLAHDCSGRLQKIIAAIPAAHFVDAYSASTSTRAARCCCATARTFPSPVKKSSVTVCSPPSAPPFRTEPPTRRRFNIGAVLDNAKMCYLGQPPKNLFWRPDGGNGCRRRFF